jgi:hypothetical protein
VKINIRKSSLNGRIESTRNEGRKGWRILFSGWKIARESGSLSFQSLGELGRLNDRRVQRPRTHHICIHILIIISAVLTDVVEQPFRTHRPSSGNDSNDAISINNVDSFSKSDTLGIHGSIDISTAGNVEHVTGYLNSEVCLPSLTAFASITCNRASCRLNLQTRNIS